MTVEDRPTTARRPHLAYILIGGAAWSYGASSVLLYSWTLPSLMQELSITTPMAGAIASVMLVASAVGGIACGSLSDLFGRRKALIIAILLCSLGSLLSAISGSVVSLLASRAVVGLGMGGTWASSSVLLAEIASPSHRGKTVGAMQAGWPVAVILTAIFSGPLLGVLGWRMLFAIWALPVLLVIPVLIVRESTVWQTGERTIARDRARHWMQARRAHDQLPKLVLLAVALSGFGQLAAWGLNIWLPAFLISPRADGGAGLAAISGALWVVDYGIGALLGQLSFGFVADRLGRRPTLMLFFCLTALLVPAYLFLTPRVDALVVLVALGPVMGYFSQGYFSAYGPLYSELFPTELRGLLQGFCYNVGRGLSAIAPITVGLVAASFGLAVGMSVTAVLALGGAATMIWIPETKGKVLSRYGSDASSISDSNRR